jgi:hypothetical protein
MYDIKLFTFQKRLHGPRKRPAFPNKPPILGSPAAGQQAENPTRPAQGWNHVDFFACISRTFD